MGQLGGLSPQGSVAVGILVGLISTSVQSLGLTLQRKSHILEDEKGIHDTRRPPYRRRRWQLGMLMFVVSNLVGSSIQITTLPLPVLSTLQASGLVFNSICATLILGEPFTRYSFGGTILVCGGAVLIAIFGAIGEPAHDLEQLLELLARRGFVLWMICQAILVVTIIAIARGLKILNARGRNSPRMRLVRGMAYGCISGILSAHSLLVAKSAVELLVRTIVDRTNQFNRWQSWIILLGLVVLALSQLYYLHRGLKLCSTSVLYPFVFCVYNIIAILDGLIYFHQTSKLSLLSALLIALGTIILLAGVLCLSWRLNDDPTTLPPTTPQTALTPGMGIVDSSSSTTASSPRALSSKTLTSDEESLYSPRQSQKGIPQSPVLPRTPTAKDNQILSSTRLRRKGITEAYEIWGELSETSPTQRKSPLPSSQLSTPQPNHQQRRSWGGYSARSSPIPARSQVEDNNDENEEVAHEETALLRRDTGRSYRARTPRRKSLPAEAGPLGRKASSSGTTSQRRSQAQDATGGWWKMRWWKDGRREGKGKERRSDESGEDDTGDTV
ncbi:hypothetical protein MMC20_005301 [Loxospora ochrophaea]|nr:hypothetical protein [Loxospora ochrophaea]